MKLRVKDLITPPTYALPALISNAREAQAERLLCDGQWRATLRRLLDSLTPGAASKSPATLVVGEAQSGKSRLLRLARAILRDPAGPAARKIFPETAESGPPSLLWLVIDLTGCAAQGEDPESLLRQAVAEAAREYGLTMPDLAKCDLLALLRALPDGVAAMVMIDDLDLALSRQPAAAPRLGAFITELARPVEPSTLSVLLAARLDAVESEAEEEAQARLRQLLKTSEVILTDCASLVNMALEQLLAKTPRQKREAAWLLHYLRQRLARLDCGEYEFIRCYPLHPPALRIAQRLWRYLPDFPLTQFLLDCARLAYHRPAISLFTLNDLFDLLEAPLRRVPQWQSLFEAYDQVERRIIPRFNPEWRLWARLLARALALHTAAELPATSRELAAGCLIYDLTTPGAADDQADDDQLIALLLDQMRRLAPEQIHSHGAPEPCYRLAQRHYRSIGEKLLAESKALDDAAPQLFHLLCTCGGTFFQDWPLRRAESFSDKDTPGAPGEARAEPLWLVEETPGLIRLSAPVPGGEPVRLILVSWATRGKVTQLRPADFVWRLAEPAAHEAKALKALAVLSEWQRAEYPEAQSPQFARLLADHRAQAERIFARLLILDGHLHQNARPVLIDREPPLALLSLLQRQVKDASRRAST
jgi:hypothetical protein